MQKVFYFVLNMIGWIAIMASLLLAGTAIGSAVYLNSEDKTGLIIGVSISVIGFILGIIWATIIWKRHGTFEYISRIYGTPKKYNKPDKST